MNPNWKRRDVIRTIGMATIGTTFGYKSLAGHPSGTDPARSDGKPERPVKVIVIGAGNRGWGAYSSYGLKFPDELRVVGVAEPVPYRRERISKAFVPFICPRKLEKFQRIKSHNPFQVLS